MSLRPFLAFTTKHTFLLLFLLTILIVVFRSWEETIPFGDELDIEDAAYGMAHGKSWIIPTINGEPFLTKPPLVYWVTAPLYTFLPVIPLTRRIPVMVFGVLLTWLLYTSAKLFYGKNTALWATLLFITSAPLISFTKTANFDLPNAFLSLLTIYLYNQGKNDQRFLYLAAISLGLGILTRSFLALVPILVIGMDYFFIKKRPPLSIILVSLSLTFLIILPWHLLAYHQNSLVFMSHYLDLPLIYHALGHVAGDKTYSPLFYFYIFLIFPATILAILYFLSKIRSHLSSIDRQLFSYCFFIFLILSLSSTRHEWYIFPIYPFISILAGAFLASKFKTVQKNSTSFSLILLFLLSVIISPTLSFLMKPPTDADMIKAARVMEANSTPQDTLYLYRYPLVRVTRFFPNRRTEIVQQLDEKMLNDNQKLFLVILTQERSKIPNQIQKRILYQSNYLSLVVLSGTKNN